MDSQELLLLLVGRWLQPKHFPNRRHEHRRRLSLVASLARRHRRVLDRGHLHGHQCAWTSRLPRRLSRHLQIQLWTLGILLACPAACRHGLCVARCAGLPRRNGESIASLLMTIRN